MAETKKHDSWQDPQIHEAHEHFKAARTAAKKTVEAWLPPNYLENRNLIRKEILLGIRSLVDAAIAHSEK